MMKTMLCVPRLGAILLLPLLLTQAVAAQHMQLEKAPATRPGSAPDSTRVYTYVEQMPELTAGSGVLAALELVQRLAVMPAEVRGGKTEGRVLVHFIVGPHGSVYNTKVAKSLSPACDAAALAAVAKLPRFVAGKQNGRAVAVNMTLPVAFSKAGGGVAPTQSSNPVAAPARPTAKVYTYAQQMPELPGFGGSNVAIGTAIRKLLPPGSACTGRVFVAFTVNADGSTSDAAITKGEGADCNAATLAAVSKLPRFKPARQDGEAVAIRFLSVAVIFDAASGK